NGRLDRAVLLDFGIARRIGDPSASEAGGETAGTLGYMAPEQVTGEQALRPAADVFSLACVAFRCLTGHRPFEAEDPSAIMCKTLFEDAPLLSETCPDVPAELDELVEWMLRKAPSERPEDARVVAQA